MSQISTGTGLFSGIDTRSIIDQLIAIDARPRTIAQQRVVQIKTQQAAYLDINSKLNSLRTAATKFGVSKVFRTSSAVSSNAEVATATAAIGATPGTYSLIADRLVSTQQYLSHGFADRNTSALGATTLIVEPDSGRIDRDTALAALNGGNGITRGKIRISDSSGSSAIIDLSRVASTHEVLEAINGATGVNVEARVDGASFVIEDQSSGTGFLTIEEVAGGATAASLGIRKTAGSSGGGGVITGSSVYSIGNATALTTLNDGNGIRFNRSVGASTPDFLIQLRDGSAAIAIDIGDIYDADSKKTASAVATFQQLKDRIESQAAGKVTVTVAPDGRSIRLTDTTGGSAVNFTVTDQSGAAADLGIVGSSATSTLTGNCVLSTLNSTLISNLNGGLGLDSGAISITARDGSVYNFTVTTNGSVSELIDDISNATGGDIVAALDNTGTGITLTDTTGGTGNLIISGDGADGLGLTTTGVASSMRSSARLQHRYVTESTLLGSLNNGRGVGLGKIEIVDTEGRRAIVSVDADTVTFKDLISEINSRGLAVSAAINPDGDGIVISEASGANGAGSISIRDIEGTVARSLNLVGTSALVGSKKQIDGSFERSIAISATDTLDGAAQKINAAGAGIRASVIFDGTAGTPFRLSLSAISSGRAGRFTIDTGSLDLGLRQISAGENARAFFGGGDPATAVLLTSTTNTFSNIVEGVSVDLHSADESAVTVTVAQDTSGITAAVKEFVTAFNTVLDKIDSQSRFDQETNRRGTLLGDSTSQLLRQALLNTVLGQATGVTGQFSSLTQVGIKVGSGGQLELDESKLRDALANDSQSVADVFAAKVQDERQRIEIAPGITVNNTGPDTFSSLGVAERVAVLVKSYTDSVDGILTRRTRTLDTQIDGQESRIEGLNSRLQSRRAVLEAQFLAMERAISQLQAQQSSLGGIRGIF